MTDGQLATLLSAIGAGLTALGVVLRWCVTRITAAIDAGSLAQKESSASQLVAVREFAAAQIATAKEATAAWAATAAAQREQAVAFAELRTDIRSLADFVHEHTPVTGEHATVRRQRTRTPPG